MKAIKDLVQQGVFTLIYSSPSWSSFSKANRPVLRSRDRPHGLPWLSKHQKHQVAHQNMLALWLEQVVRSRSSPATVYIENPYSSWLFDIRPWSRLASSGNVGFFTADACVFGADWRKRVRALTNAKVLEGVRVHCCSSNPHARLRGRDSSGAARTAGASHHPPALVATLSSCLVAAAGWSICQHALSEMNSTASWPQWS